MKKSIIIILCTLSLTGCNDNIDDLLVTKEEPTGQDYLTRSMNVPSDSIASDEPIELEETEEMLELGKIYKKHCQVRRVSQNLYSYDETLRSNLYAIRELPVTIKVRAKAATGSTNNYLTLYCDGKGKEVVLRNTNYASQNRFYIKVLPATSGIPYLIYSVASKTPLSVGYYTKTPNEKILMASKSENNSLFSCGWDLLQSNTYKKYYSIQSQSYLGQADPNNQWSVFYYVLEAVSGNKIRYAKQVANKAQQEFIITPDAKFDMVSLDYDVDKASVSRTTFTKTQTVKNTSSKEVSMDVPFDFYELENSFFNKTSWNIDLKLSEKSPYLARPHVISGTMILPDTDAAKDANFQLQTYQTINRHVIYKYPINCKASSTAKVVVTFVKYNVTVPYMAKAQYKDKDGNICECILKGTWSGTLVEDPNEIMPTGTINFTPIGNGGGDIILKNKQH